MFLLASPGRAGTSSGARQKHTTSSSAEYQSTRNTSQVPDNTVNQQADGELSARVSEQSQLMERALRSMDARAQSLHACAERLCCFFAALAAELELHEEMEAKIDDSGEQRVSEWRDISVRDVHWSPFPFSSTLQTIRNCSLSLTLSLSFSFCRSLSLPRPP